MASESIDSSPFQTKVGTSGTELETYTRTTYTKDSNGKIDPKSVTTEIYLNNSTIPGVKNWVPAAKSTDGGRTWDTTSERYQKLDKTPVFGADAVNSLKNGALRTNTNTAIETAATKAGLTSEQKKVVSAAAATKATDGGSEGGEETPPPPDGAIKDLDPSNTFGGTRDSFNSTPLYYPVNLSTTKQDVICFEMLKYEPRPLNQGGSGGALNPLANDRPQRTPIGTVILPIPGGISDRNQVNWGGGNLPVLEAMAVNVMNAGITQGVGEGMNQLSNTFEGASSNSSDVGSALASRFAAATATTSSADILSRTRGAIENPNMELLFQAPSLRPFSFQFKLTPRSNTEAARIVKIIRFFKQGMAPRRTQNQFFLRAPHTFKLTYKHINVQHKFLNYFKECALTSFSVNYTPEGQYATYTDGSMVSYEISMEFNELEPVYNDEYSKIDENADTHIGY